MQRHGIQTPVIFVTAYATEDARAGTPTAAEYVQKPIDQDDLLQTVRAVLERSAGRRPTAREHS